jgi:protein-tyrosine kinase
MKAETMGANSMTPEGEQRVNSDGLSTKETGENKLVRLAKTVVVTSNGVGDIDSKIVSVRYYNCFNYSLLPKEQSEVKLSLGITSPNPKDGKTLVASNLAVAIAMSYQRKTVLVDLNIQHPKIHEVFGVPMRPGLVEAFNDVAIHVSSTRVEHLFVLSAGGTMLRPLGLDQLSFFRDVVYSLIQEFDFVIVDMPPMNAQGFPALFTNQLSGVLVVLSVGKTKRAEIDKMFRVLNEAQVFGFVFNRVKENVTPQEKP